MVAGRGGGIEGLYAAGTQYPASHLLLSCADSSGTTPLNCCRSNYMQVKAAQEQQEQYRQYMAEQRRRQQNPFYGALLLLWWGCCACGLPGPEASSHPMLLAMSVACITPHNAHRCPLSPSRAPPHHHPCAGTPFEDLFDRGPKDPTQRPGRFGGGRSTPVTSADDVIGERHALVGAWDDGGCCCKQAWT